MSAPTPEDLLTPAEVATFFRVDPKTVTRWAVTGRIASIRLPSGHRRYRRGDVEAVNAPTASLNDLLVNALHSAERVTFACQGDAYAVMAWVGGEAYPGAADTLSEALYGAMRLLAAAREQANTTPQTERETS